MNTLNPAKIKQDPKKDNNENNQNCNHCKRNINQCPKACTGQYERLSAQRIENWKAFVRSIRNGNSNLQ